MVTPGLDPAPRNAPLPLLYTAFKSVNVNNLDFAALALKLFCSPADNGLLFLAKSYSPVDQSLWYSFTSSVQSADLFDCVSQLFSL
jgi:hypothetical protein